MYDTGRFHCPKCPRIYKESLPVVVQDGPPMCTVCEEITELQKMVLEVEVRSKENRRLLITSVGGNRTYDGSAGMGCEAGAEILSEALYLTTRETMERLAERLSNSTSIRNDGRLQE